VMLFGLAAGDARGLLLAAAALATVAAKAGLRASGIAKHLKRANGHRFAGAFAVALVYDAARSAALVARAKHRRTILRPAGAS